MHLLTPTTKQETQNKRKQQYYYAINVRLY
jgi:hypothetical protein